MTASFLKFALFCTSQASCALILETNSSTLVAPEGTIKSCESRKVSYPKKRREAAWMMVPFRTLGGLKQLSLHFRRSGFPSHGVLVYSDTNPHIMDPEGGENNPAISEHHKKRSSREHETPFTAKRSSQKPNDSPNSVYSTLSLR